MNRFLTLRRAANASPVAIAALVAANAVPLLGVLLFGWDLATLVAVYWAENGVVGIYAVGRIITAGNAGPWAIVPAASGAASGAVEGPGAAPVRDAGAVPGGAAGAGTTVTVGAVPPISQRYGRAVPPGPPPPPSAVPVPARLAVDPALAKVAMIPFFCVHYGLFWLVHGIFVWTALPMMFSMATDGGASVPDAGVVLFASIVMLVSHGVSFVVNWLLGGESRTSAAAAEIGAPYARVVILHLTIILGAFAVAFIGAPIGALVVMVMLKTGVDLAAHLGERARAARRAHEAGLATG